MSSTERRLEIWPFAGQGDPTHLLLPITEDDAPHHAALAEGRLVVRRCVDCGRHRFPSGPVCPYCGSEEGEWVEAEERGTVFSWIRYHKSYLPEFAPLMPYSIVCVELPAGIRVVGRALRCEVGPVIGQPATMVVERFPSGRCVPAFELTSGPEAPHDA